MTSTHLALACITTETRRYDGWSGDDGGQTSLEPPDIATRACYDTGSTEPKIAFFLFLPDLFLGAILGIPEVAAYACMDLRPLFLLLKDRRQ